MASRTSAGSTIRVSAAQPGTFNVAGYAALGWTAVGEITDLGEFGREYNLVTHNPIGTRATVKKKGSYNEGQINLMMALDEADAGQLLLESAAVSDNDYSFEITLQSGRKYYFQAQVMKFKPNVGSVDNITQASVMLELTSNSAGVGIVRT
ncbi:MAG: hypothetical protein ACK51V_00370 [bacterium]|jgi:hypothetical protein